MRRLMFGVLTISVIACLLAGCDDTAAQPTPIIEITTTPEPTATPSPTSTPLPTLEPTPLPTTNPDIDTSVCYEEKYGLLYFIKQGDIYAEIDGYYDSYIFDSVGYSINGNEIGYGYFNSQGEYYNKVIKSVKAYGYRDEKVIREGEYNNVLVYNPKGNNIDTFFEESDYSNVEYLCVMGETSFKNLNFLYKMPNLKSLILDNNCTSTDYSAIASLKNLETLFIYNQFPVDTKFLKDLSNLKHLYINDDTENVENLDSLSYLSNLEQLYLYTESKKINFDFIKSLVSLRSLEIRCLGLDNLDVDNIANLPILETCDIWVNADITDISAFKNATTLKNLSISGAKNITNIDFISEMKSLEELSIGRGIGVSNTSQLIPISTLKKCTLSGTKFSLEDLLKSPNLESLRIYYCTDLASVKYAANLKQLSIYNNINGDFDLTIISDLIELEELYLYCGEFNNIEPFTNLTKLRKLEIISDSHVEDTSPLINLTNLEYIDIVDSMETLIYLNDISFFESMSKLKYLDICLASVDDYSPFKYLTSLENLTIKCANKDFAKYLINSKNLTTLDLDVCCYEDDDYVESIGQLETLRSLSLIDDYGFYNVTYDMSFVEKLYNLNYLYISSYLIDKENYPNISKLKKLDYCYFGKYNALAD